ANPRRPRCDRAAPSAARRMRTVACDTARVAALLPVANAADSRPPDFLTAGNVICLSHWRDCSLRSRKPGGDAMNRLLLFSALLVAVLGLGVGAAVSESDDASAANDGQKIVVHLSHFTDDLHRCFMALELATILQESDAQVTLFLDLEGVRL